MNNDTCAKYNRALYRSRRGWCIVLLLLKDLTLGKVVILLLAVHQLGMGAHLYNLAIFENETVGSAPLASIFCISEAANRAHITSACWLSKT